ncbi:MAG: hypothetical protein ABSA39_02015 [Edaphobacter sp.]
MKPIEVENISNSSQEEPGLLRASGLSRSSFFLVCLGAVFFLYLRRFLINGAPLVVTGDESLFWGRAVHVLHGQMIYRDFFELVSPGTDLLDAAVFRVFGIHAWVIQAVAMAFGMAMFAVMTWIAGKILRGPLVLLPGVLFLVFDFSNAHDMTHHWYSTLAVLCAVGFLMEGTKIKQVLWASLFCALAVLFTQTQGMLVFFVLLIYLIRHARSGEEQESLTVQLAAFTVPFAVVLACVFGYYIRHAGFSKVFFDLVVFPVRYLTGEVNSPRTYLHQIPGVHSGSDAFRVFPYLLIYAIVPYVYLFGWLRLWTAGRELPVRMRQRLVLLHLAGGALLLAVVTGPRFFRLCTVAPPAILVLVWLLREPTRARKIARNFLAVAAAVFALVLSLHRLTQWHGVLNLPIGRTAFVERTEFDEFRWVAERTKPGDVFFNRTSLSLYLSLSTPVAAEFIDDSDFTRPDQVDAILNWLKQNPARFIVMRPKISSSLDDNHSELFRQFVKENYHVVQMFPLPEGTVADEMWEGNEPIR